ncbi:MAG: NAD(+)/NADH kinase [Clostridia bacterium]|nr:NAD(+)/NADH kinase [Clostridia bacterium]
MKIALIPNLEKKNAKQYTQKIIERLRMNGTEVLMHQNLSAEFSGVRFCADHKEMIDRCDCVIAVGGDGTIIHTARHACVAGKPILGVNLGRLGFLTAVEKDQLHRLDQLFSGEYRIRRHMMLEITVHTTEGDRSYRALNDAVISGAQSKIFDFGLSVGGSEMHQFRADGLILATPTGSTAYSLSAGGPVVDPAMECILFTPICPHSLFNRSTVFCAEQVLTVSADNDYRGEVFLTVDGEKPISLRPSDTVSVCRSRYYTELILVEDRNFYEIVDHKFVHNRG